MAITRLQVSNFRCIRELNVDLPPLTVVIGPNGAGKSTLLACLRALSSLPRAELHQFVAEYGGFAAMRCWHGEGIRVRFGADVHSEKSQSAYSLELRPAGHGYVVGQERIDENGVSVWSRDKISQGPQTESMMLDSQYGAIGHPVLQQFRRISFWKAADLDLVEVRRPQPLEPATVVSGNGENIVSVLYTLKSENHHSYQELFENLQVAVPELKAIELPLAGKGYASLNWWIEGGAKPLDAWQLSDGTLRLLWLTTILHSAPEDGVVMLDEPEISLHPQWLQFLCGLLQSTSSRTQLIVATHSDQLIRWLEPAELLVADIEDGVSRFRWGNELDLDAWLAQYSLDQLWLMGELGGRR